MNDRSSSVGLSQQLELFDTTALSSDSAPNHPEPPSFRLHAVLQQRWGIALAVLLIVGGGAALRMHLVGASAALKRTASPLPVQTMTVELAQSYTTQRSYSGEIEARRGSELGFEGSGLVTEVLVDEGDRLEAGQVVARLDTARLLAQRQELIAQQAQAEAMLAELIEGPRSEDIATAGANVRDLEAQLELAEARYQRRQGLYREGVISLEELDQFSSERSAMQARLDAAHSDLSALETGSRTEEIAAQQAVVRTLEARISTLDVDIRKRELRSPFSGEVATRYVDEGAVIATGTPVLRLVEDTALQARIGISLTAASALSAGSQQTVQVGDRSYRATLQSLLPELEGSSRTVTAILTLPADARVLPGEIARLQVTDNIQESGFWLPTTALVRSDRGLWSAYTVAPAESTDESEASHSESADSDTINPDATHPEFIIQRQELEILQTDGDHVYVRGTIQPGDQLVTTGTHRIVPGQTVTVLESPI